MTTKAIFLDRDGTLNEDPGYLNDPTQLKLIAGVGEALSMLKKAGYLLVVVSNQSGVGRGLIQVNELSKVHRKLDELLEEWAVKIDRYELCYHRPEDECECRKPKPKLIQCAAEALDIDLSHSYMIGDRISDLRAGGAAGCKGSILVKTGVGLQTLEEIQKNEVLFIGESLIHVAHWILDQENVNSSEVSDQTQGHDK